MTFKIGEPLKKLPLRQFPTRIKVYDDVLEAIKSRPRGFYPIEVKDKKPMTIYIALSKRIKDKKDLKLHIRKDIIYIEKLA